jgi:hypothetical protein
LSLSDIHIVALGERLEELLKLRSVRACATADCETPARHYTHARKTQEQQGRGGG